MFAFLVVGGEAIVMACDKSLVGELYPLRHQFSTQWVEARMGKGLTSTLREGLWMADPSVPSIRRISLGLEGMASLHNFEAAEPPKRLLRNDQRQQR